MTMAELNRLELDAFVMTFGGIFERSPWVAERAWASRPFSSAAQLHDAMVAAVEDASDAERLALLRGHPDLGARATMSASSTGEQRGAGLDRLTPEEFDRLQTLNASYRTKFKIPFVLAVSGRTKEDVLSALERRLESSKGEELAEAMRQVYRIAELRLEQILGTIRDWD